MAYGVNNSSVGARVSFGGASDASLGTGSSYDGRSESAAYQVIVQADLPVWSIDQIAEYLISGEGTGDTRRWDVAEGGTITVNISQLTAGGQYIAREALAMWADLIGVTFVEVTTVADIFLDDTGQNGGGFMDGDWTNGIFEWAEVYVDADAIGDNPKIGGPAFGIFLHEIGHALGLGHPGPYDAVQGPVTYADDAIFAQDGSPMTIMSYFGQMDNTYYAQQGFSSAIVGTPMVGDIAAIELLYGLSTTTRTGDTTYGFNSNAGRDQYDAAKVKMAYTIFDSGGIDTLDYSGSDDNQLLNLNEGAYSNAHGLTGNVAIAYGTVIENAIGGTGNDQLIGNSSNNHLSGGDGADVLAGGSGSDTLVGGAGNDTFRGSAAELSGDTISDFAAGDSIVISDATLSSFTHSLSGSTLTYSGGSLDFDSALSGDLLAIAAAGGGVQLTLSNNPPPPPPASRARLILTESGQDVEVGGYVSVIGTSGGGEVIGIVGGNITLDGSFNTGGDTVVLLGSAASYTAVLSGSFVTIAGNGLSVAIPVGTVGIAVQFGNSTRTLLVDDGQVVLGTQQITTTEQSVSASGPPLIDAPETAPGSFSRMILTAAGQDVEVGGNVSVIGTGAGGEIVTVLSGSVQLDGSFNAGGDTVVLPGPAVNYDASLSGSFVTITNGELSVAIPVGLAGLTVDFTDVDMTLRIEDGKVMLGDEVVPSGQNNSTGLSSIVLEAADHLGWTSIDLKEDALTKVDLSLELEPLVISDGYSFA